ncbi:MAG: Fe-Mn family superoxide dismutase [Nanoarchaeota archaeon]
MPEIKPLKYKELKGFLTEKQLKEHHDVLYAGYCKNTDKIREKIKTISFEGTNATYSDLRELKVEETFAVNGVRLHEAYFDIMHDTTSAAPSGKIKDLIERDFGSVEKWKQEFSACGLASRGWVVLAFDWQDMKLHNYVCDVHNHGGVWDCSSLLVLDVYEHAYFIDYATARKDYVEKFMTHIDWEEINKKILVQHIDMH